MTVSQVERNPFLRPFVHLFRETTEANLMVTKEDIMDRNYIF